MLGLLSTPPANVTVSLLLVKSALGVRVTVTALHVTHCQTGLYSIIAFPFLVNCFPCLRLRTAGVFFV